MTTPPTTDSHAVLSSQPRPPKDPVPQKFVGQLKGWRTRIYAGAIFLLGLLEVIDPHLLGAVLGERAHAVSLIAISVGIYVLRQITTTPPGRAKS